MGQKIFLENADRIVDYGAGNILSVYNSIFNLGFDPEIVNDSNELKNFDKIIIPGVGSAFKALKTLEKKVLFQV